MTHWQAFIFDFDGVMADSVEVKTRAFIKLYEPYGKHVVDQVVAHHRKNGGMNRFDKFKYYHTNFLGSHMSNDKVKVLAKAFSDIVTDEVVASSEIPGAHSFVKSHCSEIKCFINSATPADEMREIILRRGLTPYITEILGAPRSKVDNLGTLLNHYHFDPRRCLFFGDAMSDYRAAVAHKVGFMGIVPDEAAPLLEGAPDIIWKRNFHEVEKWLKAS